MAFKQIYFFITQKVLALRVQRDLGAMAINGYSTLPRSPDIEPHSPIKLCVLLRIACFRGLTHL